MNTIRSCQPNATGAANSSTEVTGTISPSLTLQGFGDAFRPVFREPASEAQNQPTPLQVTSADRAHAAFTGLVAIGSIAMLVLGR